MRTTIIPAQITTVEDKVAGSLNMTQVLILMTPILWTAIVYILLLPSMKLTSLKLVLIIISTTISGILALRIKDKIVAQWLGVLLKYRLRPKYWLYNKNDIINRIVDVPDIPDIALVSRKLSKKNVSNKKTEINIADLVRFEQLLDSGKVAVRYQMKN